jgi:hypothetical protein
VLDLLDTILDVLRLEMFLFFVVNIFDLGSVMRDNWDNLGHCD